MNTHQRLSLLTIAALSLQAAPDAGSLSKDIEKQLQQQKPSAQGQKLSPITPSETKQSTYGAKVLVQGFKISGNSVIVTDELQAMLAKFVGKRLSFSELQDATVAIADYYQSKGFSARAFLPPQQVSDGIVEIIILEGKLSAIEIEAETVKRLSPTRAKSIIEKSHPIGNTLDLGKLERGLMLLSDTPGITSASSLVAGDSAGDSKLKVKVQDASLLDGSLSYANSGSKSTGTNQLTLSAGINSPMSMGDQATVQAMKTMGLSYSKLGYTLPLGYSGFRLGANISDMSYKTLQGQAPADGTARTVGLTTSYPIIRSSAQNLTISINADKKLYTNSSSGTKISEKSINAIASTLGGSMFDSLGQTQASLTLTNGKLDLSKLSSDLIADEAGANANGKYSKLNITATRYQAITDDVSVLLTANVQIANKNLDSGEKLYLGGSTGIRAYPSSEAGGDSGYTLTAEVTKSLPYNFTAALFYDYGQIIQHHTLYANWQGVSAAGNAFALKGYGTTLNYSKGSMSAKATLSWRHGENPNPQASGNDNDGTKSTPRFWMQLMKAF
jgi:hemolysin activation/secretion protein